MLVREAMHLRAVGGELLLTGPVPALRKMIERTGTGSLLPVRTDLDAVVRALAEDGHTWCRVDLPTDQQTRFTSPPPQ
ncbi:hypothetical protein ADK70_17665 [Streptomyces rimosus subsp. pseudoverticillatus]|uniref:hypothetical protein n=1 Tax=Streptomyces rimosus TaxID=1927 RepID=UPI0006B29F56|nr:hypothetical protein [Streptomyces rimosus]KOT90108.1 hypothetical protein ADK70_17665 [Streptomyces rimosus subsp. pseudoverticillatus]